MTWTLLEGDCRALLAAMPAESVHCCVTSPPYWGLRAYGTQPQVWGGDPACEHCWGAALPPKMQRWGDDSTLSEKQRSNAGSAELVKKRGGGGERAYGSYDGKVGRGPQPVLPGSQFCQHCSAWRGELGLEPTLDLFIEHMVEVFRAVGRVLRKDGTLWLNIGDSYAGTPNGKSAAEYKADGSDDRTFRDKPFSTVGGAVKPKDMCLIPFRLALALQADGWWVRSDIIWSKPNPMPESITDRPTKAHEYLFLLAKSERYFYDADAVREPHAEVSLARARRNRFGGKYADADRAEHSALKSGNGYGPNGDPDLICSTGGRNRRSVWEIATQAFPEAHFATYPEELVRPCILAGTSERGCCPACGAPWVRKREPSADYTKCLGTNTGADSDRYGQGYRKHSPAVTADYVTTGWAPSCKCSVAEPVPCTVLDPFGGSGTTSAIAVRHGRHAIACELNPEYAAIHRRRVAREEGLFTAPAEPVRTPAPVSSTLSLPLEATP